MKLHDYIKNPAGKGAIIPGRDMIITNWDYRLQVLQKEKDIELNIYTTKNDAYYHLIIPTENKERDNTYDVVIKFKQTKDTEKTDTSYRQYEVEFFSNCPSFTYGYAYVANLNGYLIKDLVNKYEEPILKYPPVSKNPGMIFGYEKSIYFSCKYLLDNSSYLMKAYAKSNGKSLTKEFYKLIRHMNVIEEEYAKADKVMREKRRKDKLKVDKKTKKRKDEYITKVTTDNQGVRNVKKIKAKKPNGSVIKPIKKKR